jgi:hypothetical protein
MNKKINKVPHLVHVRVQIDEQRAIAVLGLARCECVSPGEEIRHGHIGRRITIIIIAVTIIISVICNARVRSDRAAVALEKRRALLRPRARD